MASVAWKLHKDVFPCLCHTFGTRALHGYGYVYSENPRLPFEIVGTSTCGFDFPDGGEESLGVESPVGAPPGVSLRWVFHRVQLRAMEVIPCRRNRVLTAYLWAARARFFEVVSRMFIG